MIILVNANNNIDVAFKSCAPFSTCKIETNDVFSDEANHIYIAMPMYNLIEYSENYSDTSESLWQFKRDEASANNADLTTNNTKSFEYKAVLVGKTADAANNNSFVKNTKIIVPLKYLSNFWRSLEMLLINWKIHPELNWIEDCSFWWLTDWIVLAYFIAPDDAGKGTGIKDNKIPKFILN